MVRGYDTLTAREKEVLRLILHGHDAKSMARELDLSVHTINEYLRQARRKLEVTSSKEAARLLFEQEGETPHFLGHKQLGDDAAATGPAHDEAPKPGISPALLIGGSIVMSIIVAGLAFALFPQQAAEPAIATEQAQEDAIEAAARGWLELVDAGDWARSYAGTANSFRQSNTLAVWSDVSRNVRTPLGATVSRTLRSVEQPPTPQDYRIVKFATVFENRTEPALETVTLAREDGEWKIVGVFIE